MKKRIDKISLRAPATILWLLITALVVNLSSCETGASIEDYMVKQTAVYDPSQPVTITRFSPEGGPVGSDLIIYGANFGSDVSLIKVTIDDIEMPVINSDGSRIYSILGKALEEDEEKGIVAIYIGEGDQQQKAVAEKLFKFRNEPYVTTLAGFKDEKGNSPSKDGPINEAQFEGICRIILDKDNNIYIAENLNKIRYIPNDHSEVKTVVSKVADLNLSNDNNSSLYSMSFSPNYSKLMVTNRQSSSSWSLPGIFEIPRSEDPEASVPYDKNGAKAVATGDYIHSGAFHPHDSVYFFAARRNGILFKWDGTMNHDNSEEMFRIREPGKDFCIFFHPDGKFAYIVLTELHQILKANYNKEKQILEPATIFVGSGKEGYEDGVGVEAVFSQPHQGCFDEEGNFYVCEFGNHVIRKITPNGIVSTFVGRRGDTSHTDGTFEAARFDEPQGIAYDKDRKVFYVADRRNRAIRMIVLPHE